MSSSSSSSSSSTTTFHIKEKESGSGNLNIALHPLVIINISDHFTREKVEKSIAHPRVLGAVFGTQSGRNVEILNSFEFIYNIVEKDIVIDAEFLKEKTEQFKKVYPSLDFLGWYSTGSEVTPGDIHIHNQILNFNENPLYILLDTVSSAREINFVIYESELHVINDTPTTVFAKIPYKIETLDAERIAVDHIAHVTPGGTGQDSMLTNHLLSMHNAIKMLGIRIKIILAFLEESKKGTIPKDHALLRQIKGLCHLLPAINTSNLNEDFLVSYNDTLLTTYLASITKGTNQINELIDKFNIAYDRPGREFGSGGRWKDPSMHHEMKGRMRFDERMRFLDRNYDA